MRLVQVSPTHVKLTGNCVFTGKPYTTAAFRERSILAWQNGTFIQDALPELSPEDREFIVSGISPEGWSQLPEEPDD